MNARIFWVYNLIQKSFKQWSQNPCKLQGKNPFYWRLRGRLNPRCCITQNSEPNTLPTELFRPPTNQPTKRSCRGSRNLADTRILADCTLTLGSVWNGDVLLWHFPACFLFVSHVDSLGFPCQSMLTSLSFPVRVLDSLGFPCQSMLTPLGFPVRVLDSLGFPCQSMLTPLGFPVRGCGLPWVSLSEYVDSLEFPCQSIGLPWVSLSEYVDSLGFPCQRMWTPLGFPVRVCWLPWVSLSEDVDSLEFPCQSMLTPLGFPVRGCWLPLV